MPDFITIDFYDHPVRRTLAWRRAAKAGMAGGLEGLRASTINSANTGTFTLVPRPVGSCLIMAWSSPDAAQAAWGGPLREALGGPGRYSLDGEVARARVEHEGDAWYGWKPSAEGAEPLASDEPAVVMVHGVVHPRHLPTFLRDNLHASSRAAHHPGHRGSIDVFSRAPFENTSVSLWKTLKLARDFAYTPGGHSYAMNHSRELETHRTGVFLRVRALASSGNLGIDSPAFPELPPAARH